MQLVSANILVELGDVGRLEGQLHRGALPTPRESCANDVNVFYH